MNDTTGSPYTVTLHGNIRLEHNQPVYSEWHTTYSPALRIEKGKTWLSLTWEAGNLALRELRERLEAQEKRGK